MKTASLSAITTLLIGIFLTPAAWAEEFNLAMYQADSGNFYVQATIDNGIDTNLLLDTGSGYVSLSKATFDRISATSSPRFSRHIFGRMANGKVEKVAMYFLKKLRLADNCVLENIEVAIFPNADRDILGLNALAKLQPFTLQLTPARLTSNTCAA